MRLLSAGGTLTAKISAMKITAPLVFVSLLALTLPILAENAPAAKPHQLFNLSEKPDKPRFALKDRDWPADVGDASICLWKDDALAAFSITIDDNSALDHEWWLEMGKKYGLRMTWFVITGRVAEAGKPLKWGVDQVNDGVRPSPWGTWEGFRKLFAAGHDIQSHTLTHIHTEFPEWKGIEADYAASQKQIEKNIPGARCLTLAYPGGKDTELNNDAIASKYYIGARGGVGRLNPANQINYMRTFNIGGEPKIGDASPSNKSQDMMTALEKGTGSMADYYRGWCVCTFHDAPVELKGVKVREAAEKKWAMIQEKVQSGQLWMALFREVCQYGQERDTAKLEIREKSASKLIFNLTDEMDDTIFDFPLTVKVRLSPSSKAATATQGGKPVECKVVQHDGANFALVQAVPDHGLVILSAR